MIAQSAGCRGDVAGSLRNDQWRLAGSPAWQRGRYSRNCSGSVRNRPLVRNGTPGQARQQYSRMPSLMITRWPHVWPPRSITTMAENI
jgi:hypothetical protein